MSIGLAIAWIILVWVLSLWIVYVIGAENARTKIRKEEWEEQKLRFKIQTIIAEEKNKK